MVISLGLAGNGLLPDVAGCLLLGEDDQGVGALVFMGVVELFFSFLRV